MAWIFLAITRPAILGTLILLTVIGQIPFAWIMLIGLYRPQFSISYLIHIACMFPKKKPSTFISTHNSLNLHSLCRRYDRPNGAIKTHHQKHACPGCRYPIATFHDNGSLSTACFCFCGGLHDLVDSPTGNDRTIFVFTRRLCPDLPVTRVPLPA